MRPRCTSSRRPTASRCATSPGARGRRRSRGRLSRPRPLRAAAVVLIGIAQEKASAWRSWPARGQRGSGHPHMEWGRQMVFINHFYFCLWDAEWGGAFWKTNAYAPWPVWIWLNGHEWARQLAKGGIGYTALDNGFASCEDPALLQRLCDRLGPPVSSGAGSAGCPRRSLRTICAPGMSTTWHSASSRSPIPRCLTARRPDGRSFRQEGDHADAGKRSAPRSSPAESIRKSSPTANMSLTRSNMRIYAPTLQLRSQHFSSVSGRSQGDVPRMCPRAASAAFALHGVDGRRHGQPSPAPAGDLTAQQCDLLPQHQDLYVLDGVVARQEHQPPEHPDHEQVHQTDQHDR
jgi:hypothetical protein